MNRPILLAYQLLIGFSDTLTEQRSSSRRSSRSPDALARARRIAAVSVVHRRVCSVRGLSCLYGALLMAQRVSPSKVEIVWLLTAFSRAGVAIFVLTADPGANA